VAVIGAIIISVKSFVLTASSWIIVLKERRGRLIADSLVWEHESQEEELLGPSFQL
jgi:hypothetical protein